jgi:hypothetical protein
MPDCAGAGTFGALPFSTAGAGEGATPAIATFVRCLEPMLVAEADDVAFGAGPFSDAPSES